MPIFCFNTGPYSGCCIRAQYRTHFVDDEDRLTVPIDIQHTLPGAKGRFRWLQTFYWDPPVQTLFGVSSTDGHFVDPPSSAYISDISFDDKPFYFTDAAFKKFGPFFTDMPGLVADTNDYEIHWITSIAEVQGTEINLLSTIAWGLAMTANRVWKKFPIRLASSTEIRQHAKVLWRNFPAYSFR